MRLLFFSKPVLATIGSKVFNRISNMRAKLEPLATNVIFIKKEVKVAFG
jgi:hypothetical protein